MTVHRTRRSVIVLIILVLLTLGAGLLGCVLGQVSTTFNDVAATILGSWGVQTEHHVDSIVATTLWEVRFPRLVLAMVVGAGLGCAGALLQGVFSNPLAEPGIIGISAGGAVLASAFLAVTHLLMGDVDYSWLKWGTALSAFLGTLLATLVVYSLSRVQGRTVIVNLILVGVAVNAIAGAFITLFSFIGGAAAQSQVVFWQFGSFAGAGWDQALIALIVTLVGMVLAEASSRKMDLLSLGESQAQHLGMNVERFRVLIIALVAGLVGVGVAFAGIIAFVGLVVPHAIRLLIGPQHRWLIPASALGGACVVMLCDTATRTLISTAELPIGMLTALIGGPVFLVLLRKYKSVGTGWQ